MTQFGEAFFFIKSGIFIDYDMKMSLMKNSLFVHSLKCLSSQNAISFIKLLIWQPLLYLRQITVCLSPSHFCEIVSRTKVCVCVCVYSVAQLCPTVCGYMDCNPLCSSVRGIFQARILDQVAISYSRESSQPRNQTHVS